MNKKVILSILLIFSAQIYAENNITFCNENRIAEYKKKIAKEFAINYFTRLGIKLSTVAAMGFVAYKLFLSPSPQTTLPSKSESWFSNGLHSFRFFGRMNDLEEKVRILEDKLSGHYGAKFLSWKWFKQTGSWVRDGLITAIVTGGLIKHGETHLHSIFGERDLVWFIATHTNIQETLSEITDYAEILDDEEPQEYKVSDARASLVPACNRLINQVETIIAFMEFKFEQLDSDFIERNKVDEIPRLLLNSANDICKVIESKTEKKYEITQKIKDFSAILEFVINRFAAVVEHKKA